MKNFKTLLLIGLMTIGFNSVQAQDKLGHIDTQALVMSMPEAKAMQTELEKLNKTQIADLKAAQEALQAKAQKYQAEGPTQTQEENQKRAGEIQQDEQKLMAADRAAQQALQNKQNELLQPIVEKANKAIQDVADENGYTYVFRAEALIIAKGTDLLPLVKAKLGITE